MSRQFERVTVSLEIVLELSSGRREARVSDLSSGGCFVDTIVDVPQGATIQFALKMPDGEWLNMTGEISHSFPGVGFGLNFMLPIKEDHRTAIYRVILQNGGRLGVIDDDGHR